MFKFYIVLSIVIIKASCHRNFSSHFSRHLPPFLQGNYYSNRASSFYQYQPSYYDYGGNQWLNYGGNNHNYPQYGQLHFPIYMPGPSSFYCGARTWRRNYRSAGTEPDPLVLGLGGNADDYYDEIFHPSGFRMTPYHFHLFDLIAENRLRQKKKQFIMKRTNSGQNRAYSGAVKQNYLYMVGGTSASIENWPWQVSLCYRNTHVCGGSIVHERFIVSAAHCFAQTSQNANDWSVCVAKSYRNFGEQGEIGPLEVETIILHPEFNQWQRFDSDIAVIRLKASLAGLFRSNPETVARICLPKRGEQIPRNAKCYVTGYGETLGTGFESYLKVINVPAFPPYQCRNMFGFGTGLTQNMICAGYPQGGQDSCQGDSGGPLACERWPNSNKFVLFGIVSYGKGCAQKNSPGVYTRVSHFVYWLDQLANYFNNPYRNYG